MLSMALNSVIRTYKFEYEQYCGFTFEHSEWQGKSFSSCPFKFNKFNKQRLKH